MTGGEAGERVPLQRARERAAAALSEAFAADELSLSEFEQRVDRCYRVQTVGELEALFDDLPVAPGLPPEAGGERSAESGTATSEERERTSAPVPVRRRVHDVVVGVMSGVGRKRTWTPAERTYTVALMGGAELDFREARFPAGETIVYVLALMGGFDRLDQDGDDPGADAPVLKIRGLACMGGVEVRVARPGEEVPGRRR